MSHVLEGSVRKSGGRVRITAQLVKGSSNDHVWAERYDRDLNDIFALQDEISEAIVKALKLKLLPEEKKAIEQRGTENRRGLQPLPDGAPELRDRHRAGPAARGGQRPALSPGRRDRPGYALAWALMALGQMLLHFAHGKRGDDGMAAAERALALDATLPRPTP